MKPKPGTSKKRDTFSPPIEQGKIVSQTAKHLVMNAYTNINKTWPKGEFWSLRERVQKTANILGLSITSVRSVIREFKKKELSSPLKKNHDPMKIIDKCVAPYNSTNISVKQETLIGESGDNGSTLPSDNDSRNSTCSFNRNMRAVANSPTTGDRLGCDGTAGTSSLETGYGSIQEGDAGIKRERNYDSDYDRDSDSDVSKPPYSYKQLIAQALAAAPDRRLTLNQIYSYVVDRYPYYDGSDKNWQNSIRHTLSLNSNFTKVVRNEEEAGKRGCWCIDPQREDHMLQLAFRPRRNAIPPIGSPSSGNHASVAASAPAGEDCTLDMY